jgi:hypothetical protein
MHQNTIPCNLEAQIIWKHMVHLLLPSVIMELFVPAVVSRDGMADLFGDIETMFN